jgi:hypothetical protein
VYLEGDAQGEQGVGGFLDDRQIAVTAHDDSNFFHVDIPSF